MSTYTAENVKELVVTTPVEGATPPSEVNDSDREIKRVLKNQFAIATKTANYTLLSSDHIILANGTFNITLPTASDVAGNGYKKQYTIINIGTGVATIVGTVDGASNPTLPTQYSSMTIETDGTNYYSHNTLSKTGGNLSGTLNEAKGAAIASAATCEIWSTDGNTAHVTGTTTIESFGTAPQAGCWKKLIFDGVLTLTHGANLILQGGANITTAAGNIAFVFADTTTQQRVLFFSATTDSDEKAKVSADDTTAGYLNGKLTAGTAITLTEGSGGGNETLSIGVTAGSIGQTQLKTATGTVALYCEEHTTAFLHTALAGGQYGFNPLWKAENNNVIDSASAHCLLYDGAGGYVAHTGYAAQIRLALNRTSGAGGNTLFVLQRYIEASRPYEPYRSNDVVPLFVFGIVDKASGKIIATYVAPDPPWANNGPTVINPLGLVAKIKKQKSGVSVADLKSGKTKPKDFGFLLENFEEPTPEELKAALAIKITQEEKNADMPLIPHPFASYDPAKQQVVVLSPTDTKFCYGLSRLHEMGESVAEVLHGDYITIDNTPMKGLITPPDVMAVSAKWK